MAHMNQQKKAIIAAELKKVMPKDWRYTLRVEHNHALRLIIRSAPINLLAWVKTDHPSSRRVAGELEGRGYYNINQYIPSNDFNGELLRTFTAIVKAMNTGNWDRSDAQTDYFDVGHYIHISIGEWDNHFQYIPSTQTQAEAA